MATFLFTLLPQEVEQRIVAERTAIIRYTLVQQVLKRQLHTQILRVHPDVMWLPCIPGCQCIAGGKWSLWQDERSPHSDYPDYIEEYHFELHEEIEGDFYGFIEDIYIVYFMDLDSWLQDHILKHMEEGMV